MLKKLTLVVCNLFCSLLLFAQPLSEKIVTLLTLKVSTATPPVGYGTTQEQPLQTGSFMNLDLVVLETGKFYQTFRWPNGDPLDFSRRTMVTLPSGILDRYTLTHAGFPDTIQLFVDPYHKAELFVPRGLVLAKASVFAPIINPVLENIREIVTAPDAYKDSATKVKQAQVLYFIQKGIGMNALADDAVMKNLIADKTVDRSLSGYLFRMFLFHRILAFAKGTENDKEYALQEMTRAYKALKQKYPEVANASYDGWLK